LSLRRAAALALAAYAALLALAAVPPEVRPRALGLPGEAARHALRAVGIHAGVNVFGGGRDDPRIVIRADCIRVRGRDADGRVRGVAPPGGDCVTQGARLVQPWIEGALRSLVLRAPAGLAEAAIGDWVCHGPRFRGDGFEEVELLWTQPWVDPRGGAEGVANAALFVWRCEPAGLVRRVLRPSEDQVRALGWGGPG